MRSLGVVLDIDDTLYLERDYVRTGFLAADRRLQQLHGTPGLAGELQRLFDLGHRDLLIDRALVALGLGSEGLALTQELVLAYQLHIPDITLLPAATPLLDWACAQGRVGIISDGRLAGQRAKVAALGLGRWAEPILLTGRWGPAYAKPSSRCFSLVARAWRDADLDAMVYVADNPAKDFRAPHALGWSTVRVRDPRGLHHRALSGDDVGDEVDDLADVLDLLQVLVRDRETATGTPGRPA